MDGPGAAVPPGGAAWDRPLRFAAADGVGLRGGVWNPSGGRGHVVLLPGRTEFLEKLSIPAAALAARGFAVAGLDWRGQGLSDRVLPDALKGHVGDFAEYRADLAALLAQPEVADLPRPRVLVAHSMGGCIALGALLRGELAADAAILSAPMLGISLNPALRAASAVVVTLGMRLGQHHLWAPLPEPARPYVLQGFDGNVLTGDRALFDWIVEVLRREPALRLGQAPTLGWLDAASAEMRWIARAARPLGLPALALIGSEERVVDPAALRRTAPRLGLDIGEIAGARHEIFLEAAPVRAAAWQAIDAFLDRHGI
ncbi:alpha/beta hydrolase [Limibaculum sp. FT325]|uniref:alpha/beta fold hydrolase n=1 Tax=Thermohalobaculum sediminis TaxID=2939436 RepID=UPI0020C10287|nr:alpha/beta hydrolase [Limibaculum sediminis]MCL5775787.1 alpha/beta hydrolase [Limibaculum sediminis]